MKPHLNSLILLGFAFAIPGLPGTARAQSTVTCSSYDGGRHYCGKFTFGDIRFSRQLSESSCVLGKSWGIDQRGLWVDRGCRAEFTVRERASGSQGGYYGGTAAGNTVTCSSNDGRRHYCGQYNRNDVRLSRKLSESPCVLGTGWGVDQRGLWVDRGCRAEFTIRGRNYGGRGSYYGRSAAGNTITCSSNDGRRHYCGQYNRNDVRLSRKLSESPCVLGTGWGVDQRGLWVDRGCRAEFTIRGRGHGTSGGYYGGAAGGQTITCSSNDGRRHYCGQYNSKDVRLSRRLSESPCVRGTGWGVDQKGLWVDRGCRAEFTVRRR